PVITEKAQQIVSLAGACTPQAKARAIFLFVRDGIKFGFTRRFDNASPDETLRLGVGHCNPQGALFASLLQAQGIPARQRFVSLSNGVLRGVLSVPPPRLLHSYEDGGSEKWVRVDGYIADAVLFHAAKAKLKREDREEGYGVHSAGLIDWDGESDCFCQMADERRQVDEDLGAFDVPESLYNSPRNFQRLPWFIRLAFGFFAASSNSWLDAVRA
ncbi:unnamed protein product, partial [Sphacelaria rigidula]